MKCLFLFHDAPLSYNFSGAASRYLASFHALSELGVELYVWRMVHENKQANLAKFELNEPQVTSGVRQAANEWQDISYSSVVPRSRLHILWKSLTKPINLAFASFVCLKEPLIQTVHNIQPDFLWAEHAQSAALVTASEIPIPWIYSHHDWIYKVHKIRQSMRDAPYYFSQRLLDSALRRAERSTLRGATAVITGSKTEASELRQLGANNVQVIPTSYPRDLVEITKESTANGLKIVHLGSLETTANYQGLMAYMEKAHPHINQFLNGAMELVIIGEADKAKPILLQKLQEQNASLTGHVCDLTSVLNPYDIAILPYEHDTGYRTKLPLLFQHAQTVVATEAAIAGMSSPGIENVCVIVKSIEEFPSAIKSLAIDKAMRKRLGQRAIQYYQQHFTYDSVKDRYRRLLSKCNLKCE